MDENAASVPFLPHYSSSKLDNCTEDQNRQTCQSFLSKIVEEVKELYLIAFPMIIAGLLIYGKSAITMLFLGKLNKETLAGGCLAIGIANISGYSVISGLATGMEGISSQAYGAKQWPLMGQTLQRTMVILIITSIPISVLWLNFETILITWGQKPSISSIATTYLAFSIPDLLFHSIVSPLKIYLRTQKITLPLLCGSAFSLALHAPINYVIFHHFKLGIRGIALAGVLTDFNLLTFIFLYLWFSGVCEKSWQGWSTQCFKQWKPILKQAIPSCISICLEWWWYEIMIILSGLMDNAAESVATTGILIQATSLYYNFPFALGLAVSTRVGNELGANQPSKAKLASLIALLCALVTGLFSMMLMLSMRNVWGQMFTTDDMILSLTAAALPVVGICELGNCPQTTICGVLRGSARPTLGANINLGSFYGVGLPVAVFMGFVMDLGFLGLWFGLLAAQAVCAIIMFVVLVRTDWTVQAERATQLMSTNENEVKDDAYNRLIPCL